LTLRAFDYIDRMAEAGQVKTDKLDPEAEARRRLALGQIRQYPDPALRMRAREVEDFDGDLRRLAERMTQLMRDASGVGLAATQIGIIRRVFVVQTDPDEDPIAVVNPVVVEQSDETVVDDEGCLSLQGVQMPVERPTSIRLEGRDLEGGKLTLDLADHAARVVQHELDHLDGVLILDRTTDEARKAALALLRPKAVLTP
jgi:peptide deformylase